MERDVHARWVSEWVAYMTDDWDTTGSARHEASLRNASIPPMIAYGGRECRGRDPHCGREWSPFCCFYKKHVDWYRFARASLHYDKRLEVTFSDSTSNLEDVGRMVRLRLALSEYIRPPP